MNRAALVVILALVLPSWPALGVDVPETRKSLKGLSNIYVLTEDFREHQKRAGFDGVTFQTDVEVRLRMAGIKVVSREEMLKEPGMPALILIVNSLAEESGKLAPCSVNLELSQRVRLARDLSVEAPATTWSVGGVVLGNVQHVRGYVKDLVDMFINAWLRVNPKE